MKIFNKTVTVNETPANNTVYHTTLLKWLKLTKQPPHKRQWKATVEAIREAADNGNEKEKDRLKPTLPAITPSACHSEGQTRNPENLEALTGFLQADIDLKENPHLPDAEAVKQALANNPVIAYAALSTSGKGVWALIPVAYAGTAFNRQFEQLKKDFYQTGINLDPVNGGNPQHLRLFSFDPNPYINPEAKTYTRIAPKPKPPKRQPDGGNLPSDIQKGAELVECRGIDITNSYEAWFSIGNALANELGESGRALFHTFSQFHPDYNPPETDRQYNACLKFDSSATKATLFHFMALAGIYLKEHKTLPAETPSHTQAPTIPSKNAFSEPDGDGYREPVTESDRKQVYSYMANRNRKLNDLANRLKLVIE
jgi:hypothetical protein